MNMLVARKLHERRFRANPIMTTGELLALIGNEGLREALDKRWIVPEMETGFLTLNLHGGKLVELEEACRCKCGKTDCACTETTPATSNEMPMREAFAGYGLPRPGGVTSTPQQPALPRPPGPQTPTSPAAVATRPKMGDPARVKEGNQEFVGTVSGFDEDGRIRLRWSGNRPSHDRSYGPYEIQVGDKPAAHA